MPPTQCNYQHPNTHNKHNAAFQNQVISCPKTTSHKQCPTPFPSLSGFCLCVPKPTSFSPSHSFASLFLHNCPDKPSHPAGRVGNPILGQQQLLHQTHPRISTNPSPSNAFPASAINLPPAVHRPTPINALPYAKQTPHPGALPTVYCAMTPPHQNQ